MGEPTEVTFRASELDRGGGFGGAEYTFRGDAEHGWTVARDGRTQLELGPGYRLLRTERCGVCSTDLARHLLPFPLPQIVGHELVARDERGRRFVVEINASHQARGTEHACPFCRAGLAMHCPERLVLGIDRLPGGFGPWVLAPVAAAIPVPDPIDDEVAVLVEPFAAALKALTVSPPRAGDTVAVLGTGRLGMLLTAALAGHRRASGTGFRIVALGRRARLAEVAVAMGADEVVVLEHDGEPSPGSADLVFDTTGDPDAAPRAAALAARELHLKSTHGMPAGGIAHATELVVDEIALARIPEHADTGADALGHLRLRPDDRPRVAWPAAAPAPRWLCKAAEVRRFASAGDALAHFEAEAGPDRLPRADVVAVDRDPAIDQAIRPDPDSERALVRPRGEIWLRPAGGDGGFAGALACAVIERGLRISASRCGDFRAALDLLAADAALRERLRRLVTHHVAATDPLGRTFDLARSGRSIKVVVDHEIPPA